MHGNGEFIYEDGGKLKSSCWVEGAVTGIAEEFDPDGNLAFTGEYEEGVRQGKGHMYFLEGTSLQGTWKDGALSEEVESCFFYPDKSVLRGIWTVYRLMT